MGGLSPSGQQASDLLLGQPGFDTIRELFEQQEPDLAELRWRLVETLNDDRDVSSGDMNAPHPRQAEADDALPDWAVSASLRTDGLPGIEEKIHAVLLRYFTQAQLRQLLTSPRPTSVDLQRGLGAAIRTARSEHGLQQRELAAAISDMLGVRDGEKADVRSWVSKAEVRANPNLVRLAAVAGACRLPPSFLLRGAECECALRSHTAMTDSVRDAVLPDLFAELIRTVKKGDVATRDSGEENAPWISDWRNAVSLWKAPTPEMVDGFCKGVAFTLRRSRVRASMTLSEVVAKARTLPGGQEFSAPYLSQLETGAARPSLERLALFTDLYGIPMTTLFRDAEMSQAECPPSDSLNDLQHVTHQLMTRVNSLYAAVERGTVPPENVADVHKTVPLIQDLSNKVAAMENPNRRPGRRRKDPGS